MASAKVNSDHRVFQAVADGSVNDLREILEKEGFERTTQLAQSFNEMGETPLLVAIGKQHFSMMEFLIEELNIEIGQTGRFVSNGLDYASCPPLFAAIVSDQGFFAVDYLISRNIESGQALLDLDSVLSSSMTCRQKSNVLKLMGATYLLSGHCEHYGLHTNGLSYWGKAMALASSTADVRDPQIPYHSSTPASPLTGSDLEMMTLEQWKRMAHSESEDDRRLVKEQALHVSQRVLSEMQLFPNGFFISHVFKYTCALPAATELPSRTRDEVQHLSNSAMYTLQLLKVWWQKYNPTSCIDRQPWFSSESLCRHLLELLLRMSSDHLLPFSDLMFTLDFACEHLHRMFTMFWPLTKNHRATFIGYTTSLVRNISAVIFRKLPQFSDQERQQFKECLSHYIRLYRGLDLDGPHLLHDACSFEYVTSQKEANYDKVVEFLLEAGEDPNATDGRGNTPLHCLLAKDDYQYWLTDPWDHPNRAERTSIVSLNYLAVIKLLLDSGCHIDQPNKIGDTILQLLKRYRKMQENFDQPFDPYLLSVVNAVLPLTCHCAQFIRKHHISTEQLPLALQLFVRRHGTIRRTMFGSTRLVFDSTSR